MIAPESSSKSITGRETTATGIRLIREAQPPRWKLYALSIICMHGVAGFTGALAYSTRLIAKLALRNVSFDIKAGEKVAIIGRSGSGKSTLIDLVPRFHDPTGGTIRIGGYNASDISNESMRAATALISQDVFLFDSTILENIRDGNAGASDEDVERAARRAALTETLGNMPAGLQTVVGPNGSSLSGGQKQRIGIARALVKDADICVFDEATSALDVETEKQVLENVTKELDHKTVLFVTHRPATLDYVDRILLLDEGRLVSIGTKKELETGSEQYRALLNIAMKES
ncbi:ATP-binding cassette domain-containing protein [uncultured Tateyamaria sp.]|uniref:ABC transporter ATP-binding protein n=1 Tax=uncultured Tateyamaria sp. TaxID=455651 RepID=UPI002614406C|nr:ATP-binding cassette domain-containing protein [uncultured Tateyamaria sp.]